MKSVKIFFLTVLFLSNADSVYCMDIEGLDEPIVAGVICGGSGARLWPVSREDEPKPFMRVVDERSFLQQAFLRGAEIPGVSNVLTVTNQAISSRVQKDYSEVLDSSKSITQHFVLEPCARNTAPAIAAACLYAQTHISPNAILLILAADHHILDQEAFSAAVANAVNLAKTEKIVTFGITPRSPETGYGYIEFDGTNVVRFVEKPDLETAKTYVDSGQFLWNSGMFCFKVQKMLTEMQKFCPEILLKTQTAVGNGSFLDDGFFKKLTLRQSDFEQVPSDSIDYTVMEKTSDAGVVPCDIGWSDIGCWRSLSELIPADASGNRISGDVVTKNTENCTIIASDRVIGTVGLNNLAIIDTPDALLVVDKNSAQDVKSIVTTLKSKEHPTYKTPSTVTRPWGTYTVLSEGPGFKVKSIMVNVGGKLSLQSHEHRSENWTIASGQAKVLNGEDEFELGVNGYTFIPAKNKHRLENIGLTPLILIETQTGGYLGEDDIIRYEDVYGRA